MHRVSDIFKLTCCSIRIRRFSENIEAIITSQVHLAANTKDFIIQKNNKNGIKLSHESFSYVKDRGSNFRCVRYNKTKKHPACPGRVHLLNNLEGPVLKRVDHNHKPDPTADSITTSGKFKKFKCDDQVKNISI